MTVAELITALQGFDPNADVKISTGWPSFRHVADVGFPAANTTAPCVAICAEGIL